MNNKRWGILMSQFVTDQFTPLRRSISCVFRIGPPGTGVDAKDNAGKCWYAGFARTAFRRDITSVKFAAAIVCPTDGRLSSAWLYGSGMFMASAIMFTALRSC